MAEPTAEQRANIERWWSRISGLHFSKEALSDGEKEILALAEELLAEVERLTNAEPEGLDDENLRTWAKEKLK
jgi:hypothetical protein